MEDFLYSQLKMSPMELNYTTAQEDRTIIKRAFLDCVVNGQPYDLVFPFTTKQGDSRWIRTTAKAVYDEDLIVKVIGNIADITSLKKVEISAMEPGKHIVHS